MYENIERFRVIRNCDIFELHYIFVPMNMRNSHWGISVIDMKEREVKYIDSYHDNGRLVYQNLERPILDGLVHFSKKEWACRHQCQFDETWKQIPCSVTSSPRQENGFDCGVFVCVFADLLSPGHNLDITQNDLRFSRQKIAESILSNLLAR